MGQRETDNSEKFCKDFGRHISTIVQTILAGVCIYVIYLLFGVSSNTNLLTWHVFCVTVSFVFLMPWAILNVSDLSILSRHLSRDGKHLLHGTCGFLSFGFGLAGFVCILVYKEDYNSDHFKSDHGKVGLAAIIAMVVVAFGGLLLKTKLFLLRVLKICHPFLAIAALALGLTAECLGFKKGWFVNLSSTAARDVCISLSVISCFWVVIRPVINILGRLKN